MTIPNRVLLAVLMIPCFSAFLPKKISSVKLLYSIQSESDLPTVFESVEADYRQRFQNVARLYPNSVDDTLKILRHSRVLVVGLGGVGSWVVEALARSGVGKFTLIDMDDICISNTNRQIQALTSSVGKFKGDALRSRVEDINPYAEVEFLLDFLRPDNVDSIIATNVATLSPETSNESKNENENEIYELSGPPKFDFVVDAADGVTDKSFIIDACVRSGTPVVVSGGVGGLTDPTMLRISDMTTAVGDNLIMSVRKKLRQKFGYPAGARDKKIQKWNIPVVHSLPIGQKRGIQSTGGDNDASTEGTSYRKCDMQYGNACFATGTSGFLMASVVVNSLCTPGERKHVTPKPLGTVGRRRGKVPKKTLPGSRTAATPAESVVEMVSANVGSDLVDSGDGDSPAGDCSCSGQSQSSSAGARPGGGATSGGREGAIRGTHGATGGAEDRQSVLHSLCSGAEAAGLRATTALADAHCHLQLEPVYSRASEAILTARSSNVSFAVVCGTCPGEDWAKVRNLYESNSDWVKPQFGLHPWWIKRYLDSTADAIASSSAAGAGASATTSASVSAGYGDGNWESELEQLLVSIPQAGVGECGLDKAINKTVSLDIQNGILKQHMQIAARHNRPVTMHCVGAWGTLRETIKWHEKESKQTGKSVRAYVLHSCNSMPPEMAASFASIPSVYFSFTARSLGAKETRLARSVPLDRILIETDSPDQLPLPLKGRLDSNEPCLIRHSCTLLAQVLQIDPNTLAEATVANAQRVFGI